MPQWKQLFNKSAAAIETNWDGLRHSLTGRLGLHDPIQIVAYRSYGTPNHVYIKGRVLEDKKITSASDRDTVLNNLLNMYKRFESDEVQGAELQAVVGSDEYRLLSDEEGYFVLDIKPKAPIVNQQLWHQVHLKLISSPIAVEQNVEAVAEVMIPPSDAEYGIISDIDDTIVQTSATNLMAMGKTVLLANAKTRLPFAGVSEFYKALQLGRNGKRNNPFFYVSSSPWNLYDLLKDFLDLNEIPAGPLLLRDFGFDSEANLKGRHMSHKFKEISQILQAYPEMQFVLVGDSGQEDPMIYQEVVKQYPNRILAVYIRDVQLPERERIALDISKTLAAEKVEMLIVDNTVEAAAHAAKNGLIYTSAIPAIEQEKKEDKGQEPGKEPAEAI